MDTLNGLIEDGEYIQAIAYVLGSLTAKLVTCAVKAIIFWAVGKIMLGL